VYEIVKEERGISSEMALRLARYFGTTAEFWMNLQAHYDLAVSRRLVEGKIKRDVRPMAEVK
jgi:antitoxin HigA-1